MSNEFSFTAFKNEFVKEVEAQGGCIELFPNGDFIISIPLEENPNRQLLWEKGNLQQRYEDFLKFVEQQEKNDLLL